MRLYEKEIFIPIPQERINLIEYFHEFINHHVGSDEIPTRFVITETTDKYYKCDLGFIDGWQEAEVEKPESIFSFRKRKKENKDKFNVVMMIPTGIGAELGGHAGDANPTAQLLASACDNLILHPNVVNASDINEMTDNTLYVEGSILSRFLMGMVGLQKSYSNRVLSIIDEHQDYRISELVINAVSTARVTLGLNCPLVVKMDPPIGTKSIYSVSGRASGVVENFERICKVIKKYKNTNEAIALSTSIDIDSKVCEEYYKSSGEMINPWGGAEAILTHAISTLFNIPSAHAPMIETIDEPMHFGITDPRIAPEAISSCYMQCVFKGLHKSPQVVTDPTLFNSKDVLSAEDISCLVIPENCIGLSILGAIDQEIPIIAVKENRNTMKNSFGNYPIGNLILAENYLEAVGIIQAMKKGIYISSVRRPFTRTKVVNEKLEDKDGK